MTVLKRRTRMVNFRLSEDEYKDLKNVCITNGARSVSDFAREAVCNLVGSANGGTGEVESSVRALHGKFEELDREVKRLARALEEVAPPPAARKAGRGSAADSPGGSRKGLNRERVCGSMA